jgi:ElaB/YqjD/DUF883 family membrane-anchored ribosome-binding protein
MGQDAGTGGTAMSGTRDPEQIRQEIEETRAELGDTVAAMAHKTDVKAQANERLGHAKATVSEKKEEFVGKAKEISPDTAVSAATEASHKARQNPLPLAITGAFAVGFLVGRLTTGRN